MSEFNDTFKEVAIPGTLEKIKFEPKKVILEIATSDPARFAALAQLSSDAVLLHMMRAQGEIGFYEDDTSDINPNPNGEMDFTTDGEMPPEPDSLKNGEDIEGMEISDAPPLDDEED